MKLKSWNFGLISFALLRRALIKLVAVVNQNALTRLAWVSPPPSLPPFLCTACRKPRRLPPLHPCVCVADSAISIRDSSVCFCFYERNEVRVKFLISNFNLDNSSISHAGAQGDEAWRLWKVHQGKTGKGKYHSRVHPTEELPCSDCNNTDKYLLWHIRQATDRFL